MRYRFCTLDVFTEVAFGGNPLAVLPDARGLSDRQMQCLAREFNYSESTFVLPARHGHTREVRIFTPTAEVPFAGHPNIGTAHALAALGEVPADIGSVTFEEKAGLVEIGITWRDGRPCACELRAPQALSVGREITAARLADVVGLASGQVLASTHAPCEVSVGLPFLVAELRDREALAAARVDHAAMDALAADGIVPDLHLYVRSGDDFDLRTRMFAPRDGLPEDAATGSANCALAALLARLDPLPDVDLRLRIAQGVEMGRPSALHARVEKRGNDVTGAWIGGASVLVSEGWIECPADP